MKSRETLNLSEGPGEPIRPPPAAHRAFLDSAGHVGRSLLKNYSSPRPDRRTPARAKNDWLITWQIYQCPTHQYTSKLSSFSDYMIYIFHIEIIVTIILFKNIIFLILHFFSNFSVVSFNIILI